MRFPRAILIDLDDTLYRYAPCHASGMANAQRAAATLLPAWRDSDRFAADCERARREIKENTDGQAASHSRLLYFKRALEDYRRLPALAEAMRLEHAYWQGYASALAPDAGVKAFLSHTRARKIPVGVLTNFTTEIQIHKLRALGLLTRIDWLFTSEEAGADKPALNLLKLAIKRMKLDPAKTWSIGDNLEHDALPALHLGLSAFWLRRTPGEKAPAGVAIVDSWAVLIRLLKQKEAELA